VDDPAARAELRTIVGRRCRRRRRRWSGAAGLSRLPAARAAAAPGVLTVPPSVSMMAVNESRMWRAWFSS
jgi:hypothetical protein